MNISPLLGRFAIKDDRKGIVVDAAAQDFQTRKTPTATGYEPPTSNELYVIAPASGGWRLLVLVEDKLEVWPAENVRIE